MAHNMSDTLAEIDARNVVDGDALTKERAMKQTNGKIRYDLLPMHSLHELALVYSFGAAKYADDNWRKGIPFNECIGALFRHFSAFCRGEDINQESGLPHLAHAAFWCFTLIEFARLDKFIGFDNRKDADYDSAETDPHS